ncbi:MAG: hypothetical protein FJ206_02935 [Gemmatimonadetes bacterium]|nr:hypothetical protein [Gemmatimonadota bacterium]
MTPSDSHPTAEAQVRAYFDQSLSTIVATAEDLRRMTGSIAGQAAENPCLLRQCPRHQRLLEVVDEAVAVLEATKGAFRSRQLAELRRRLEHFLAEERGLRAPPPGLT